jgi:hypothetical protein
MRKTLFPCSADAQDMQASTSIPKYTSQTKGPASRPNSHSYRKASTPIAQDILKMKAQLLDVERDYPEKSSSPLHLAFKDVTTMPAPGNDSSTEVPRSRVDQGPLIKMPASIPSTPARNRGQWLDQETVFHERSSTIDNLPGVCGDITASVPLKSPSKNISVHSRTADLMSHVHTLQTAAVAHEQTGRGYQAQSRVRDTATDGKQNQIPLPDRVEFLRIQGQLSFNAINPQRQSEVSSMTLSAGTRMPVTIASGILHGTVTSPAPVQSSNTEFQD